jgi:hypothetical protein
MNTCNVIFLLPLDHPASKFEFFVFGSVDFEKMLFYPRPYRTPGNHKLNKIDYALYQEALM